MNIRIFGTPTSGQQLLLEILEKYLSKAKLPFTIKEETDISVFIDEGIESVPAIEIDGKKIYIDRNDSYNMTLRKMIMAVLKKYNYGMLQKVIIPVDFSDISINAFMFGHRLASDLEAITKAVHVYYPSSEVMLESTTLSSVNLQKQREQKFDDFIDHFNMDWSSDIMKTSLIGKEFKIGFPGEEILGSINENDAQLVIMGSTGDSGSIKKWFGSISTKVMHHASCPVLLIPENAKYSGVNNIMYAYDNIDLDKVAIEKLIRFSEKFEATLHLVHIQNNEEPNPGYYLKEVLGENYPKEKIKTTNIVHLDVVEALEEYAKEYNIDIISMTINNRSFFSRIFHDSMTYKMALHTEMPLLIMKA